MHHHATELTSLLPTFTRNGVQANNKVSGTGGGTSRTAATSEDSSDNDGGRTSFRCVAYGTLYLLLVITWIGLGVVVQTVVKDRLSHGGSAGPAGFRVDSETAVASRSWWNDESWSGSSSSTSSSWWDSGSKWFHDSWKTTKDDFEEWKDSTKSKLDSVGNDTISTIYEHASSYLYDSDVNNGTSTYSDYKTWIVANLNGTVTHFEQYTDSDGVTQIRNYITSGGDEDETTTTTTTTNDAV